MTDAPRLDDTSDSDFLGFELLLDDEDRKHLGRVRAFSTGNVEPVINYYWPSRPLAHQLTPQLKASPREGDRGHALKMI